MCSPSHIRRSFCCLRLCYVHLCTIFHDKSCACNFSTLFTCSRSGSPQNVMHSSSIYCHSLGNWIGLSAPGLQFIQASYTADTWSGRAARVLTISDHVMYNFRTSTWVNLVTPNLNAFVMSSAPAPFQFWILISAHCLNPCDKERGCRLLGVSRHSCAMAEKATAGQYETYLQYQYHEV